MPSFPVSGRGFVALLLLSLSLLVPSTVAQLGCNFSIVSPNTSYPTYGVIITGFLTYNTTRLSVTPYPGFSPAYNLLSITGTRTVYTATAAARSSYVLSSTSSITGLLPANNSFLTLSNNGSTQLEFATVVNALAGLQIFYDNVIYPQATVLDHMDTAGWVLTLSTPQLGSTVVNGSNLLSLYSFNSVPSIGGDISDDQALDYLGPGFDVASFNGNFSLTCAVPAVATVRGDPQMVGLRDESYQVHGIDGAVYNIISEKNTQVNSRFVFLSEGECPNIDGVADDNCWSHPGSYMGELSFQSVVDGELHAALISAGKANKGFSMVQVDGKVLKVGDKVSFGFFSLEQVSTHKVVVNTDNFEFELSNSDMFVNQQLRSKTALSKLKSHGLLGQTHSSKNPHFSPQIHRG